MRILILGANGMLGSEAVRVLHSDFEVWAAVQSLQNLESLDLSESRILTGIDAMSPNSVDSILEKSNPNIVINAIGIIKQNKESKAAIPSIGVNSLWPHVLADKCEKRGIRLIHVSTDCVFSGDTCPEGGYRETDFADAGDLYGRSKFLGEVTDRKNTLTMRTSIVGWQRGPQTSLFGWFSEHRNEPIKGFSKAVFSGLTATALVETMRDAVFERTDLYGLYHVSAKPIDKYSLLSQLAEACGWDVDISPSADLVVDKTLNSERFQQKTGWVPPSWEEMLADIAKRKPE